MNSFTDLNKNLRNHYTDNIYHTHVSMVQPRGKMVYNRNDLNDLYKDIRKNKNVYGIAEKNQQYMPIIVDIDIKQIKTGDELVRLYNIEKVKSLISMYNSVIKKNVINVRDEDLSCIYLNKDPYIKDDFIKNGFHLHYPKIFVDKDQLKNVIIPEVSELIKENSLFTEKQHDNAVTEVPWLMYGAVKEDGLKPYEICRIYNSNIENISLIDGFLSYKIFNEREKQIKLTEKNIEKYLVNILSIIPYGRSTYEVQNKEIKLTLEPREIVECCSNSDLKFTPLLSEEQQNKINNYLPHIKQEYIEDTKKWFVMYNLLKYLQVEDETILEICSRTSLNNYNETTMTKSLEKWNIEQFLNYGKNGSIKIEEHIENLRKMTTLKKEKKQLETIEDETILQHEDVALLFIEHFGSDYKITTPDGGGYKWSEENKLWIYNETSFFVDISKLLTVVVGLKNIQNIKTVGFMKSVWNIVYIKIYDKSFLEVVDKNCYEIPIKGGRLINLKTGLITERTKNDLWSFELNFNIVQNIRPAEEYIATLFDSPEVRTFIKKLLGYFITGSVEERKGFFFVGDGRNGKSLLQNILSKVFKGSRFVNSLMKTVLIKNNSHHSSGPTPELGPLQYSRMGFTSELEKEDKLDDNKFKSITGSDDITHRPMYMKGEPLIFKTQCKLICSTNEMPTFGVNQQSIQDRIVVIEFKKRFEDTLENRRYAEYLETPEFIEIFGSYIIKGAIEYCNSSLIYPQEVLTYTKSIFDERDTIGSFLNEKCKLEVNEYVIKNVLYNNYTNFCAEEDKRFETKQTFCKYIKKIASIISKQKTVHGRVEEIYIGIGEK